MLLIINIEIKYGKTFSPTTLYDNILLTFDF